MTPTTVSSILLNLPPSNPPPLGLAAWKPGVLVCKAARLQGHVGVQELRQVQEAAGMYCIVSMYRSYCTDGRFVYHTS